MTDMEKEALQTVKRFFDRLMYERQADSSIIFENAIETIFPKFMDPYFLAVLLESLVETNDIRIGMLPIKEVIVDHSKIVLMTDDSKK
jgi:hypothetical protein